MQSTETKGHTVNTSHAAEVSQASLERLDADAQKRGSLYATVEEIKAERSPERANFLQDVIITAVEGGTGYWAYARKYKWSDEDPGSASVELGEFDCDEVIDWHRVDCDVVERGIKTMLAGDSNVNSATVNIVRVCDAENTAASSGGDVDAEVADCIVQAGLFGKLVYG